MARNKDEEVPQFTGFMPDPATWPTNLPEGVTLDPATWYAHRRTYADGRTEWQFFQRGSGPVVDGKPQDAVYATVAGVPIKSIKEQWDKEAGEEKKGDQEGDTRGPQTGPQREVYRSGKWVTEDNPLYRADGSASTSETQKNEAALNNERSWNADPANIPKGASGFRDTHAEAAARKQKAEAAAAVTPKEEVNPSDPTRLRKPDGKGGWVDAGPNAAGVEAAAARNRGTTTLKPDGKGGTIAVTTYPDGRAPTTVPVPGVPSEAPNKYREVKQDPTTGKWSGLTADGTWEAIEGGPGIVNGPGAVTPEGAPPMSGKLGEAAADMAAFIEWLNKERRKPGSTMTNDQADNLVKQRRQAWDTAIKEQEAVVNAQSATRGQDISQRGQTLGDLSNRRSSATSIANQASGDLMSQIGNFGEGGGGASLAAAIRASRANAQDFVTMTGANRDVPEVGMGPAQQAIQNMPLPGSAGAPNLNVRSGGPNAIGAGAVPGVMAPGAGAPPEIPMTPERVRGIMQNPVFRPQPMVSASVPPMPGQGQDLSTPQAMAAPPPQFLAGSSRGHVYDPTPSIQAMIADPRYDNATLRAVVQEQYPGYPIDDLLGAA